jgi:hypothetical protein
VWREAPILKELHSLTNNEARQFIKAKGWNASKAAGGSPNVAPILRTFPSPVLCHIAMRMNG